MYRSRRPRSVLSMKSGRPYSSPVPFNKAMIASGSVTTLASRTTFPTSSTIQIAVSLTDTSRPTECFMAVLPLHFVAGLPGPVSHVSVETCHLRLQRHRRNRDPPSDHLREAGLPDHAERAVDAAHSLS